VSDFLSPIVGDPAGMRALAATLRSAANTLGNADDSVWSKARATSFTGPAAERLKGAMGAWHGDMSSAANELSDTADLLVRAAAEVEAAQRERARHKPNLDDLAV
jgi:uncharacterized protein YukE